MTRERLDPKKRSDQIVDAALQMAQKIGYMKLTRDAVAQKANVSTGLVTSYFTMPKLRDAVMRVAVKRGVTEVVAQGLIDRHPVALKAPQELRKKAIDSLHS